MKIIDNIIQSYTHIPYTLKHKMAMIKLEKQFTGRNSLRIILHDSDKIFTYIFLPFLTLHQHKGLHRKISKHHHYRDISKLPDSVLREIILDWESCHYTKSDKPETAREYCLRIHPYCYKYLAKYLDSWNI